MTDDIKRWIANKPVLPNLGPCPACKGLGLVGIRVGCDTTICPACRGSGVIEIRKPEVRRCGG